MGHQFRNWDQAGQGTGLAQGQTQIDYAVARLKGWAGSEGPSGGRGGIWYSVRIGLQGDSFCPPYFLSEIDAISVCNVFLPEELMTYRTKINAAASLTFTQSISIALLGFSLFNKQNCMNE